MSLPLLPELISNGQVIAETNGCVGLMILNRPEALNALSLAMVRDLTNLLLHWQRHPDIQAVVLMGINREGKTPAFCAGGDIRFFYDAALRGDPELDAFFTEEYSLVHLIHHYAKPCIVLMDGIVMGGGMGLAQGAKLRVLNEHSRLAMPEARIGLFPDVGGGYFLGQCPGATGEWLALTGQLLDAGDAISMGLADVFVPAGGWDNLLAALRSEPQPNAEHVVATVMERVELAPEPQQLRYRQQIDRCFGAPTVADIRAALSLEGSAWAEACLAQMAGNSPQSLYMGLELVRRARRLGLADALRMERNLMHGCFAAARQGSACEALEGIRARVVNKGDEPVWLAFDAHAAKGIDAWFESPWPVAQHPLAALRD